MSSRSTTCGIECSFIGKSSPRRTPNHYRHSLQVEGKLCFTTGGGVTIFMSTSVHACFADTAIHPETRYPTPFATSRHLNIKPRSSQAVLPELSHSTRQGSARLTRGLTAMPDRAFFNFRPRRHGACSSQGFSVRVLLGRLALTLLHLTRFLSRPRYCLTR